jgi:recombinational DNA repair ATPase RecF
MLRHLDLHNFKAWTTANLRLAPITGLFGTNSSGKTSLIQFLLLLKLTKEASDRALALDLQLFISVTGRKASRNWKG